MLAIKVYKQPLIILLFLSVSMIYSQGIINENSILKNFGTSILISLIVFIKLVKSIINGNSTFALNFIDIIASLILIAAITTQKENFFINNFLPLLYLLLYISIRLITNGISKEKYLLSPFYIVIITHIIIVVCQRINIIPSFYNQVNNGSTFGNPDMLASYLSLLLSLCFIKGYNTFNISIGIITIFFFIFIEARTALLSIIMCVIVWLCINKKINFRQLILAIGIGLTILFALIYWRPESVFGRLFVWYISVLMIIKRPQGWGAFAFEKHYPEFQASYLSTHNIPDYITPDIVHSPFNEFLNIGVTLGILGLLIYTVLIVLLLYYSRKSNLLYPIVAFIMISVSYFPFSISPLMLIIVPVVAFISNGVKPIIKFRVGVSSYRIILLILISLTAFLLTNVIKSKVKFNKWQEAVIISRSNGDVEQDFQELYPSMKTNGRFLLTYANFQYKKGKTDEALQLMEEAQVCFCDIRSSINLAKLYNELGMYNNALEKYNLAINIAPDKFNSHHEKILFFIENKQFKEAYELCVKLENRNIKKSVYIDPYIIKERVRKYKEEYEHYNRITISYE